MVTTPAAPPTQSYFSSFIDRDPELFERLDRLAGTPLHGNKELWDELCLEIGAGEFYEYLQILVEIVQEGKWRTNARNVRSWLRGNLGKRAVSAGYLADDYAASGKRRRTKPRFDKRSGALIDFATIPFVEFEARREDGVHVCSDEAVSREYLKGGGLPPADRKDLKFQGGRTRLERFELTKCALMADELRHDRASFDEAVRIEILNQQWLAKHMKLDRDEAEVYAVTSLLWGEGPKMYLPFLQGEHKKRVRNAWDRLNRKIKKPEWSAKLRKALRNFSEGTDQRWDGLEPVEQRQ